ncbi:hypothetical protein ACWCQ0_12650 [Streptomyces massasporeus]|uniref:Uncharacterized protein n=1 Tax=Streptomyces massasporeus TaxID=67324 RepID=A0ABW6LMT3_9ACTN
MGSEQHVCPACGQPVETVVRRHKTLGTWVPLWVAGPCHNPECGAYDAEGTAGGDTGHGHRGGTGQGDGGQGTRPTEGGRPAGATAPPATSPPGPAPGEPAAKNP